MATTPTATPDAPPNFYAQAAKMTPGASPAASSKGNDDKQEFLKNLTKLLTIMGKMGKQKPGGVDISKEMKAAADAVEKALAKTSGAGDDSSGPAADATGDAAPAAGTPPPDTGATGQ